VRVEAKEVLAQTVRERDPERPYREPDTVSYGRASKIAEITSAAIEFINDFLIDYDIPSTPMLKIGNIRGFEDVKKTFSEITAVIQIQASFTTLSRHKVRMDFAVPLYKGAFQRPSIVFYQGKRRVFSQDLIDEVLASVDHSRPVIKKPLGPDAETTHVPNVEKPLFAAPPDPTEWSLLITERY
jgi:hypothetical protein